MSRYEDHKMKRMQWLMGAEAEYQGFAGARIFEKPLRFTTDEYVQRRYEAGFEDGKMLLAQDEAEARQAHVN